MSSAGGEERGGGAEPSTSRRARGRRMASWPLQILLSAALLALAALGFGWGESVLAGGLSRLGLAEAPEAAPARPAPQRGRGAGRSAAPVIVAAAEAARNDARLELTGGAVAAKTATLRALVEGRVREMAFAPGDRLEAGAPALRLEDRRERLAVSRAEAALAEARRRLARAAELRASGAGASAVLEAVQTEAALAEIALAEAEEALADRMVRAPFAGVISLSDIEIGDRITPADAIAALDDRSRLLVEIAAPETAFGRLRQGAPVAARTVAYPGERFAGKIAEIDSRLDPATRSVRVRVEIQNEADRLRPGMSFVITLDLPGETVIAAPELALQWEREGAYLWRIRDGAAERAPVRLLAREGGRALLRDLGAARPALAPGDLIVVEGVQRLREGREVRLLRGAPGRERSSGPRPAAERGAR